VKKTLTTCAKDLRRVLDVIREHCSEHPPLHPLPSREGEEEGMQPPLSALRRIRRGEKGGEMKRFTALPEEPYI